MRSGVWHFDGRTRFRSFRIRDSTTARWLKSTAALRWEGYRGALSKDPKSSDSALNPVADGSIEPPFLIGTTCGSCHISFDPLNPPKDPANPEWANLKGGLGNQYSRVSEILTSGMSGDTLEAQMFAHARPGTSDTSAIATDQVHNPGTMNAIINTKVRPTFSGESVIRWRKVASCSKDDAACWCEPGRDNKCWQRGTATETVHHILKGGEDSIGALEAIQRVYFTSARAPSMLDEPSDRSAPARSEQSQYGRHRLHRPSRRDCPNFRAIEDRLPDILAFLMSKETDATTSRCRANAKQARIPRQRTRALTAARS